MQGDPNLAIHKQRPCKPHGSGEMDVLKQFATAFARRSHGAFDCTMGGSSDLGAALEKPQLE
jgi:hypothetical protein